MGRAKDRKVRFLSQHPLCCFCGGETTSSTSDHIPPRSMFRNRVWPVGYEFPACQKCNSQTAGKELVMALLARSGKLEESESEQSEYVNLLQGIQNNYPDFFKEIEPTATQVKGFLRERGLRLAPGLTTRDVPLISVKGPLVKEAIETFSRKLFLALHYLHTGRIVPQSGGVSIKYITNASPNDSTLLENLETLRRGLPNAPDIQRSNTGLEDQFSYKYFTNPEGTFSAYFVFLGKAFAIIGNVRTDRGDFPEIMHRHGVMPPFQP